MHNVIRLSPTVTLRLAPRSLAAPLPLPQKPHIKLKPKSRQALTGITNVSIARTTELDDSDAATTVVTPSHTMSRHRSRNVRVPGPFIRIRHVQNGCFSAATAVRDINGGRELRGRVLCLKIFPKKKVIRNKARHVVLRELLAYKAMSAVTGDKWLPFVMRLDASLEDAYNLYFAMDLMDCDLLDILEHWPSSARAVYKKQWIVQMATGIAAIHRAGILHRDIKPENILIDFRRNVRIADFGCAFVNPGNKPLPHYGEYCFEVCGTWPYQAPELLANEGKEPSDRKKYGTAVDYWSLGCVIFELEIDETRPLFDSVADLDIYEKYHPAFHQGKSYLEAFGLSPDTEDLILGLLRVSPTFRFGKDIRRHRYFADSNGVSEFEGIESQGAVLNDLSINYHDDVTRSQVKSDNAEPEVFCPAAYPERGIPDQKSFNNYCWINPAGIWGTVN